MDGVRMDGRASLELAGRLEWDAGTGSYRVRGPALDADLGGYLGAMAGGDVRVMVCQGRRQRWILIEGMGASDDGQ